MHVAMEITAKKMETEALSIVQVSVVFTIEKPEKLLIS